MQIGAEAAVGRAGRCDHGAVVGIAGIDSEHGLQAGHFDQAGAQDLDVPARREEEGQALGRLDTILGAPGVGLVVQEAQFQRARGVGEGRVNAQEIGEQPRLQKGRGGGPGGLRGALEANVAHETVRGERLGTGHLGYAPAGEPPEELHLPVAILQVDEAQGEHGIVRILRETMGDAGVIAQDLDGGVQAVEADLAAALGRRTGPQRLARDRPQGGVALPPAKAQPAPVRPHLPTPVGREVMRLGERQRGHCRGFYVTRR